MLRKFADARFVSGILWSARIMGVLLVLLFLTFAAGEGLPNPANLKVNEAFMFLGLLTMVAGILVALKWEGPGAVLIIDGFILFLVVEYLSSGSIKIGFIFFLFPFTGLMFFYYWWQTYKQSTKQ